MEIQNNTIAFACTELKYTGQRAIKITKILVNFQGMLRFPQVQTHAIYTT